MGETATNGIERDDAGAASDPTFVRRLIIGMVLVVVLSAPTLVASSVASSVLLNPAGVSVVMTTLTVPIMSSGAVLLSIYGFWYALASAFVHSSAIGALACKGADSPWIAIGLGCAIGLIVPFVAAAMNTAAVDESDMVSKLSAVRSWPQFALTGTAMGWINWRIAIRPRRMRQSDESLEFAVVPSPLRAVTGIVLTSLAAGPMVALMTLGGHIVGGPSVAAPLIIGAAAFFGIFISLPASVINAVILSVLLRLGLDDVRVSVASGAIIGLAIPLILSTHDETAAASAARVATVQPAGLLVFAATGALMGALYWIIAVQPHRRRRLAFETAAMREFARALQDGQQHDRRIPWDGRNPPE